MNILFIHETEYIEKVVIEFQIIPEILASEGHNVYMIDFPMSWKKKSFFDFGTFKTQHLTDVRRTGKKKGITLVRPGIIKIPGISRLVAFFAYFFIIPRALKEYKIDKIVLYSVPTNGVQTVFWAKRFGIPIHFRLLDVLHQLVPSKILSWPTFILEKYVYKRVSEISAITPMLVEYAIEMGGDPKTTFYLPSGSDLDFFYPEGKNKDLIRKFGITEKDKVVLFAGTLYNFSGLDVLIEYMARNREATKDVKLIIVGHGQQADLLNKLIAKNRFEDRVILTGFIDYAKLPKYINLADVCINPFQINKITDIIFPGKVYQYMASEKPVIATRLHGVLDIFPDNGGKNNIYYFDLKRPKEFFQLVKKIGSKRVKDVNPSLQEISEALYKRLEKLK
ncbi:MAG: glycosyltransferase [Candidatus Berkelbacteria bacterium]